MEQQKPFDRIDYTYKLFVIIAISIAMAVLASDIVTPILISAFMAVILFPVVTWLEKKLSLTVSVIIVLSFSFLVFAGIIWIIGDQLTRLVQDLPDLEDRLTSLIDDITNKLRSLLGMTRADQRQMTKDALKGVSTFVTDFLLSTTNTLSLLIQIPIYIFLFLIYRDRFKDFFAALFPNNNSLAWKKDIETVLQSYISGLLLVTVIIAVLNTVGLALLGIDHAIFFGVFAGLLTIIPYVGIFIGALLPAIFALLTKDSIWYTVGVVVLFSFIQFLEGNFITPRITGSKVSINALAAIVALLIGGKILGIAGMILAIPITGVLRVLLSYTVHLKPFVILLEDTQGANGAEEKPKEQEQLLSDD